MFTDVAANLRSLVRTFAEKSIEGDSIYLGDAVHSFDARLFRPIDILMDNLNKTVAFVDGGQAVIFHGANFAVSLIRVCAQVFSGLKKKEQLREEFFLITFATKKDNQKIWYESQIFVDENEAKRTKLFEKESSKEPLIPELLLKEKNLLSVNPNDSLLKTGKEPAKPVVVASMARRFAELALAQKVKADYVVLDGTLEAAYPGEEKLLENLGKNVCALAKSSSLLTASGNNPNVLLNKCGLSKPWVYPINEKTSFVKLHPRAKHVFRFEGNKEVLPYLLPHAADALFLGYPYGLVLADKMARVSNQEQKSFFLQLMLNSENKEILSYLTTQDAHSILDSLS